MDISLLPAQHLQTAIAQLEMNIGKGVTSIEVAGEKVTFRSLDDMLRTLAFLERRISRSVARDLPSQHYPAFRRG